MKLKSGGSIVYLSLIQCDDGGRVMAPEEIKQQIAKKEEAQANYIRRYYTAFLSLGLEDKMPKFDADAFLDWMLSEEGSHIVTDAILGRGK